MREPGSGAFVFFAFSTIFEGFRGPEAWNRGPVGNLGPEAWKCGLEAGNPMAWDASEADNSGKSGSGGLETVGNRCNLAWGTPYRRSLLKSNGFSGVSESGDMRRAT